MKKILGFAILSFGLLAVPTDVQSEGPPREGCYICYEDCMRLGVPKGGWYCPPEGPNDDLKKMPGGSKPYSPLT